MTVVTGKMDECHTRRQRLYWPWHRGGFFSVQLDGRGTDFNPVSLPDLQAWVSKQHAPLPQYFIGANSSYAFIVPAEGEPRVVELQLSDSQAKTLDVEPDKWQCPYYWGTFVLVEPN